MSDVAALLAVPMLGAAQGAIFGIFIIAAAGKLAACRPCVGAMCVKGGIDLSLALLICLVMTPPAAIAGALAAILIGAGGWLRERISKNTVCNCFGIITHVFHPWRNGARAILFVGGVLVLALAPWQAADTVAFWAGAAAGLSVILAGAALALARSPLLQRPAVPHVTPITTLPPGAISPATVIGSDAAGRPVTLQELAAAGEVVPLLLTAPGCRTCESLKAELAPLLPLAPLRLIAVVEGGLDTLSWPSGLADPQRRLRHLAGIRTIPALLQIDVSTANLTRPIAIGPDAIKGELLHLVLAAQAQEKNLHSASASAHEAPWPVPAMTGVA